MATPARKGRKHVRVGAARTSHNVKLARCGTSLGLRIPQEVADQLQLRAGAEVSIEVR